MNQEAATAILLRQLLQADDDRLQFDPLTGLNGYGVSCLPQDVREWGSATVTGLSAEAPLLAQQGLGAWHDAPKERQTLLSQGLVRALGLSVACCDGVLFSSGSAALGAGATGWDRVMEALVLCSVDETGSRVPEQMRQSLGIGAERVITMAAPGMTESSPDRGELAQAWMAPVTQQVRAGRHVLLVLTDVAKSGRVLPHESVVMACQQRFPDHVRVLVDACQLRLSTSRLAGYLARGWRVAVTGSKFMGGPPFSGALLAYRGGQGELSSTCRETTDLPLGAFLRWWAALSSIQHWQQVDKRQLSLQLDYFRKCLSDRLSDHPSIDGVPVARLGRMTGEQDWDDCPTIFPFFIRGMDDKLLGKTALQQLFLALPNTGRRRAGRWGQPLRLGRSVDGSDRWALRLCLGARQLLSWSVAGEDRFSPVNASIESCLELLEETVALSRSCMF